MAKLWEEDRCPVSGCHHKKENHIDGNGRCAVKGCSCSNFIKTLVVFREFEGGNKKPDEGTIFVEGIRSSVGGRVRISVFGENVPVFPDSLTTDAARWLSESVLTAAGVVDVSMAEDLV